MAHYPLPINRVYLALTLAEPTFDDTGDHIFYVRMADGRRSIVRQALVTGLAETLTAEPVPGGGVGYGQAIYAVRGDTLIYAARDGRLHGLDLRTGEQWPVTPAYEGVAGPAISPRGELVAFLAEQDGRCNILLADLRGKMLPIKISADPWYAFNPTFSPDGTRLAWQEWNELDMPWDEARLLVGRFAKSTEHCAVAAELLPVTTTVIAKARVSYASPQFSPDGRHLAFTSDESGWRSLWVGDADGSKPVKVETGEGEIGLADWVPGLIAMRWSRDGRSIFTVRRYRARDALLRVAWPDRSVSEIPTSYGTIGSHDVRAEQVVFVASSPTLAPVIATVDVQNGRSVERVTSGVGLIDAETLAPAEVISWKTVGGATSWGVLYRAVGPEAKKSLDQDEPLRNESVKSADGQTSSAPRRPLIVMVHGGPTSERPLTWDAQAQYFATRGYHYLMVNHRGGTGYGRDYQDLLRGQWGIVDVEDARSGAEYVIERGLADPQRVVITGGSAGGYTTLMALTRDPDFWAAGIALFGVGNLYDLRKGSHRFEVNYELGLVGPLPQAGKLWKERSPLTHVGALRAPVLLFHGKDDKAVPHQQSVDFAEAVRRNQGVAELVSYEGEGHGFVRETTRRDLIEKMEAFLDKYVLCQQR